MRFAELKKKIILFADLKSETPEILEPKSGMEMPAIRSPHAIEKIQTVRVHVKLLDSLFNLSGELIINKNRIDNLVSDTANKELRTVLSAMDRMISALQENVSAARLVPIDEIFQKFPRMVRDLGVGTLMLSFGMMVESLKMVTREIRDTVNVLASSSSGILGTTTQVSSGTSEVQKSLIEVTTKVEEGKRIAKDIKSLAEQFQQEKALTLSLKQLAELNEVASAVDNIKQTIAQNVESISQAEATAQNLNALGQKLKNIVEQFKV